MNIIFIAPPAAGKGTQAKLVCDKYQLTHLSTGNLLREISKKNEEINQKLNHGLFIEDSIILTLIKDKFKREKNFVLDGFPRNLNQAQKFEQILLESNQTIDYIFYLKIEKENAKKRIIQRMICPNCNSIYHLEQIEKDHYCNCGSKLIHREDDSLETFLKRFEVYEKETKPVLDYYKEKDNFYELDGNLNTEQIFQNIINIIGEK